MNAISKISTLAIPAESFDETGLEMVAMFCAAGLAVSLVFMSYGLDLSAGFF